MLATECVTPSVVDDFTLFPNQLLSEIELNSTRPTQTETISNDLDIVQWHIPGWDDGGDHLLYTYEPLFFLPVCIKAKVFVRVVCGNYIDDVSAYRVCYFDTDPQSYAI